MNYHKQIDTVFSPPAQVAIITIIFSNYRKWHCGDGEGQYLGNIILDNN